MLCFKRKFSKKVSKLSLNLCFTPDLHHLQDHFSNFLLNLSSLAKSAKKRDLKAKRRFALQNMQLYEMPSPKYIITLCL